MPSGYSLTCSLRDHRLIRVYQSLNSFDEEDGPVSGWPALLARVA